MIHTLCSPFTLVPSRSRAGLRSNRISLGENCSTRLCSFIALFLVVCPATAAPAPLAYGVGDDGLPRELAGPPRVGASRQKAEYEFFLRAPWPARSGTAREDIPNFRERWHRRPSNWTDALQLSARYTQ